MPVSSRGYVVRLMIFTLNPLTIYSTGFLTIPRNHEPFLLLKAIHSLFDNADHLLHDLFNGPMGGVNENGIVGFSKRG